MDLKGACLKYFNAAIESAPVDSELKKAARRHHQFVGFQERLYKQVMEVEMLRMKKGKPRLKANTVKDLIFLFVHTYLAGVEGEARRKAESDIAKHIRETAEQKTKDLDTSLTTGKLVGEYEEFKDQVILTDETTR